MIIWTKKQKKEKKERFWDSWLHRVAVYRNDLFCLTSPSTSTDCREDRCTYLPFTSRPPRRCTGSIPYSQCLRIRWICSEDQMLIKRCRELKEKLAKRRYPRSWVISAISKISIISRADSLQYKSNSRPRIKRHLSSSTLLATHHWPNGSNTTCQSSAPAREWGRQFHRRL